MRSIYDGYTPNVTPHGEEAYFIGANTGRGFLVRTPFTEGKTLEHLYILKGGAGTGKSTFMKKTAAEAEKAGIPVTLYRCSSDPYSLDAVILGGRIAVTDGTAPHVVEMKYPGVCSTLLDVSQFLDGEKLKGQREEIIALTEEKSACYRSAYRFQKAAEVLDEEAYHIVMNAADSQKLMGWAERTAKDLVTRDVKRRLTGTPAVTDHYTCAIGMKGCASLSTFRDGAEQVVSLCDAGGVSHAVLEALGKACAARGLTVVYGRIPVNDRIRELYLPEIRTLFTTETAADAVKIVNTNRFLRREALSEVKERLRFTGKCREAMLGRAEGLLAEAGKAHFALEEINTAAMEFKGLRRYMGRVISEILSKFTAS